MTAQVVWTPGAAGAGGGAGGGEEESIGLGPADRFVACVHQRAGELDCGTHLSRVGRL